MSMRGINYCIIDQTDPNEEFECEGDVLETYFGTSNGINGRRSLSLIRKKVNVERSLRNWKARPFNILHLAAHGNYIKRNTRKMDSSPIYRGQSAVEIFRPDTLVRAKVECDVFMSTCCLSFNEYFLEVIEGYGGVRNFIAPKGEPFLGDTIVFALMFYNGLIYRVRAGQREIKDKDILEAFRKANQAYIVYGGEGSFRLYNSERGRVYK